MCSSMTDSKINLPTKKPVQINTLSDGQHIFGPNLAFTFSQQKERSSPLPFLGIRRRSALNGSLRGSTLRINVCESQSAMVAIQTAPAQ